MYSRQELQERYDRFAKWYNLAEFPAELFLTANLRRQLLRNASGKVLEIGVGTGRNLQYYPQTCQITAIDLSKKMLEIAKKHARKLDRDITFRIADAETLPFQDNSFDTLVDSGGLCTYPNPIKALKEISRVCKPTGKILLLEHGRSSYEWLGRYQDKRAEKHAQAVGCYWNREPLELVYESRLEVTETRRTFLGMLHIIQAKPH